ncbi:unnamed protein product [Lactuca saligna]|uniref:Uncharacterized protein n=1 Tax=Lactuca saligna TaxID=75948 RepID=A0AA35ZFP5_LACSI|nr:unnamed protein product [Lactuca saligna]
MIRIVFDNFFLPNEGLFVDKWNHFLGIGTDFDKLNQGRGDFVHFKTSRSKRGSKNKRGVVLFTDREREKSSDQAANGGGLGGGAKRGGAIDDEGVCLRGLTRPQRRREDGRQREGRSKVVAGWIAVEHKESVSVRQEEGANGLDVLLAASIGINIRRGRKDFGPLPLFDPDDEAGKIDGCCRGVWVCCFHRKWGKKKNNRDCYPCDLLF